MTDIGIDKFYKKLGKTVNPGVRICVECGSYKIIISGLKKIKCQECGSTKRFSELSYSTKFRKGDQVRIVDLENSDIIYTIKRISKSIDGKVQYLLKSDDKIKLLYHESNESHLEKI